MLTTNVEGRGNLEESEVGLREEFQDVFYFGKQLVGAEFWTPSFKDRVCNL